MRRGEELGPDDGDRNAEGRVPPPPERSGNTPRQVLIAVFAVVLIAFAIANFKFVEVNFLLFSTRARVVTVVAVAGVLGFLIGYIVGRPTRDQRKRLRRLDDDRD
ncbi:MAG: hypothetical protein ACXWXK_06140 [Actinomycetota bacterium]